jgi:Transposase DDE domain
VRGPAGLPLVALVQMAGIRWRVEEAFQAGKGLCGLDRHQVRRWRSWYRWVTLAMLAYAFLVVARGQRARSPSGTVGAYRVDLQRAPAPLRRRGLPATVDTGCAGRGGVAATRLAPVPATTAGKPTAREDHDLRAGHLRTHPAASSRPDPAVTGR